MSIRIQHFSIEQNNVSTRMPFRYGIVTMTQLPHVFVRAEVHFSGQVQMGVSADHIPPKWFTKNPDGEIQDEIDEMLLVLNHAAQLAASITHDDVFGFWYELYQQQTAWALEAGIPQLLAHFGTSLVERVLIDAFCRFQGKSFHSLLISNAFGIRWDKIRPELKGLHPKDLLPAQPLASIVIRHTVGLVDVLWEHDILEADRLHDGLPQSLEACIGFYGLKHFKIKVCGDVEQDQERLKSIAQVFVRMNLQDFAFTLDGNEQFRDVYTFMDSWNALQSDPKMETFFDHLLFVEQPFHRALALTDQIGVELHNWKNAPPIIIDESDADLSSLPRALKLGYRGTSHKNCKGVFKGIINRATINHLNRSTGGNSYLMSGEDLSNIGPIANHQDLVVQASLANASVERNGHHYFKGLSGFDPAIGEAALRSFPTMYTRDEANYIRLNINNGKLKMTDLLNTPFGTDQSHFENY